MIQNFGLMLSFVVKKKNNKIEILTNQQTNRVIKLKKDLNYETIEE